MFARAVGYVNIRTNATITSMRYLAQVNLAQYSHSSAAQLLILLP